MNTRAFLAAALLLAGCSDNPGDADAVPVESLPADAAADEAVEAADAAADAMGETGALAVTAGDGFAAAGTSAGSGALSPMTDAPATAAR